MADRLNAGRSSKLFPVGTRLRDLPVDPLESIGLPSKGDDRLLDFKAQEDYFGKIVERYDRLCAAAGRSNTLHESLASLSLGTTNAANGPTLRKAEVDIGLKDGQTLREFSVVIMAMRKIREAIVASSRIDAFAASAYSFIIRATIMEKHVESYHPALLHLLRKLYNTSSCSASEKHEFVGYYILDLACRQSDLAGAFAARNMYDFRGTRVELVLKALVHGNWSVYWKSKRSMNEFQKRLMELGEAPMRKHALKCLGRSYLSASMLYVEEATGMHWKELKDQETLGWEQDGEMIIIKQIKRK